MKKGNIPFSLMVSHFKTPVNCVRMCVLYFIAVIPKP